MGSCASKPKYVDYERPTQQETKENEEHDVKREVDGGVSPTRHSGSRPSLGILFQKEKDEQGELLKRQDDKLKISNPSANVLVSDKLENSGACAMKSVITEDQVKPTASLAYAKEVPEEPSNHKTVTASLDSSSTDKAEDAGTNLAKINDLGLPTATQAPQSVEVSDVDQVENITGIEGCMTAHESKNKLVTVDTATERAYSSSSLKDDNLNEDAKNSLKPGTELPVVIRDASDDIEDNSLVTKITTGHVDNIEKSQDPEVKVDVVNDHQKSDVKDEVLGTTLPVSEGYVLNEAIDTCLSGSEVSPAVGVYISNVVKDKTLGVVAIDRNHVAKDDSGNSLKSETMIANDVSHTSGDLEHKEACDMKLNIENHDAENFLKSGNKLPAVDNLSSSNGDAENKVSATQQGAIDNNSGNDAENSLKVGKEVPDIDLKHFHNNAQDADLDVTMPINGSRQEACSRTENTDSIPVEDHHSNSNTLKAIEDDHSNSLTPNRAEQISESIKASGKELDAIKPTVGFKEESSSKTKNADVAPVEYHHGNPVSIAEEQFLESKKASVAEYVDSVVPTSIHVSPVVEESALLGKETGERLVIEPVEMEGLHRRVEELKTSSQSDHLVTKKEAETTDVDNNANQYNECSEKNIRSSPQVHQEELTQTKHLPVLESASKGNCQPSSTKFAKELPENDKVPNVESVEGAPVSNTHHVKGEL